MLTHWHKAEEVCQLGSHQPGRSVCRWRLNFSLWQQEHPSLSGLKLHNASLDCLFYLPQLKKPKTKTKNKTFVLPQTLPQSAQMQPGGQHENSRVAEMCSITWTNIKQWGRRMFSFHKLELKKNKNKTLSLERLGGGNGLQLWEQWGHCWYEWIPWAIPGKVTCGNGLIPLKRNKHFSPLMA